MRGLSKQFYGRIAVNDLDLTVAQGEIVGLLGPNGAGKTTTLRSILGIYRPDRGEIGFGDGLGSVDQIGYLPEERGLYPDVPVLDTLVYLGTLKGVSAQRARRKAVEWLERVGLAAYADRRIETLSKGMQQKIQFVAAVLHEPLLGILDEPFSGLDPVNQDVLIGVIHSLHESGMTLLLSSHQMNLVESVCQRIVLVDGGEVVLSGGVDEIKRAHGVQTARLTFEGDGSFLKSLPGIHVVHIERGQASLRLDRSLSADDFLRHVTGRLRVTSIQVAWPPLHDIFIDVVKKRGGGALDE